MIATLFALRPSGLINIALAWLLVSGPAATADAAHASRDQMCRMTDPRDVVTAWAENPDVRSGQIDADLRASLSPTERERDPEFDGYRLGVLDYRWRYVDARVEPGEWPPIEFETATHPDGFVMTFRRGRWGEFHGDGEDFFAVEPEPGPAERYVFARRAGCWVLVAADDTSLPDDRKGEEVHWPSAEGAPVLGIPNDDLQAMEAAMLAWRDSLDRSFETRAPRSPHYDACMDGAGGSDPLMTDCEFDEQQRLRKELDERVWKLSPGGIEDSRIEREQLRWQQSTDAGCAWYPTFEGTLGRLWSAGCTTNRMANRLQELQKRTE